MWLQSRAQPQVSRHSPGATEQAPAASTARLLGHQRLAHVPSHHRAVSSLSSSQGLLVASCPVQMTASPGARPATA